MTMNYADALMHAAKTLPVWPTDEEAAQTLNLVMRKMTGWAFRRTADPSCIVYALSTCGQRAISRAEWERACKDRYGDDNCAAVDDDGDFVALFAGELAEKGDAPQPAAVLQVCPVGHHFSALADHPLGCDHKPICPHCMALALDGIKRQFESLLGGPWQ